MNPIITQIYDLEALLSNDDYKIIKCAEASVLGLELPYDLETLYLERQLMRDEINRLQKLASLMTEEILEEPIEIMEEIPQE